MGNPRSVRHDATPGLNDFRLQMIRLDQSRPVLNPVLLPQSPPRRLPSILMGA